MSFVNTWWPQLELEPDEREWCGIYAEEGLPGVLPRQWPCTLIGSSIASENVLRQTVNFSGRRTRIYAMTASGDIAAWRIKVTSQAGEQYITGTDTSPGGAPVATLLGLEHTMWAAESQVDQNAADGIAYLISPGGQPLLFDPNLVIEGVQGLVIEGELSPRFGAAAQPQTDWRAVLNLCWWVWEFPEFPRERGLAPRTPNTAARRTKDLARKDGR